MAFSRRASARYHVRLARAVLASALVLPAAATAQTAAPSDVELLNNSRVSKTGDLEFGRILPGSTGGSITVGTDSSVTTAGSVISVGGTEPASFLLERQINVDYVTYVSPTISDTIEITHESNPTERMTVRNFTTDFERTKQGVYYIRRGNRITGPFTGTVPGYWNQTSYDFRVGGTLDVAANQQAGTYSGSFVVTIDYN